jgi:hypothetical protein
MAKFIHHCKQIPGVAEFWELLPRQNADARGIMKMSRIMKNAHSFQNARHKFK